LGHPPDQDALFQTKAFDCLSLVETTIALAATADLAADLRLLNHIRYQDGKVDFALRNHFVESQWIVNNQKDGWLEDITRSVGSEDAVLVSKQLSPELYRKRKQGGEIELPPERIPKGNFHFWMIPLDKIQAHAAQIPSGTLLFVVRADFVSIPTRISHVGIIVQKKSVTNFRHAKDEGAHAVVDMPLVDVVNRYQHFTRWPVVGFSLYLPTLPQTLQNTAH